MNISNEDKDDLAKTALWSFAGRASEGEDKDDTIVHGDS